MATLAEQKVERGPDNEHVFQALHDAMLVVHKRYLRSLASLKSVVDKADVPPERAPAHRLLATRLQALVDDLGTAQRKCADLGVVVHPKPPSKRRRRATAALAEDLVEQLYSKQEEVAAKKASALRKPLVRAGAGTGAGAGSSAGAGAGGGGVRPRPTAGHSVIRVRAARGWACSFCKHVNARSAKACEMCESKPERKRGRQW